MKQRTVYYKRKKMFYLLSLIFLSLFNQVVSATEIAPEGNTSMKQSLLSKNFPSKNLNSVYDSNSARMYKHKSKLKKKHTKIIKKHKSRKKRRPDLSGLSDAEKLAGLISGTINCENRDCPKPQKINAVKGFLATLWVFDNKSSHGKLVEALTVENLNQLMKMEHMRREALYSFIIDYLQLSTIPNNAKKKLKERIIASHIFPKKRCESCLSTTRSWGWSLCCCGVATLPLSFYISNFPFLGGLISTGTSLICSCCVAECFLEVENIRMRLVNLCVAPSTKTTCNQKIAIAGGPKCLEKCLEFNPYRNSSSSSWEAWIHDMQSIKYIFQ